MANNYRLSTGAGHHQTALQSLPKSIGLANARIIGLDALRKQRALADYEGDPVPDAILNDCIREAEDIQARVRQWIQVHRPDLA